jgi:ABC-2 type transport system ATP-binding protein
VDQGVMGGPDTDDRSHPQANAPDSGPSCTPEETQRGARVVARELSRSFGNRVALDRIGLEIAPGECFGLLGANGAGKTTFIRMVTGFLVPSAGEVTIDGYSPVVAPRSVQRRIGFISETSHLYPELKVVSFLRFAAGIRGLTGPERTSAVLEVLERFDLSSVRDRRIGNLSKGFQQRISIAQAFIHRPTLVIADEPTGGLDPLQRMEVHEHLAALRGRQTLLLCTHDLAEARALTQRVAILFEGKLVALGATQDILTDGPCLDWFRGSPATDTPAVTLP